MRSVMRGQPRQEARGNKGADAGQKEGRCDEANLSSDTLLTTAQEHDAVPDGPDRMGVNERRHDPVML